MEDTFLETKLGFSSSFDIGSLLLEVIWEHLHFQWNSLFYRVIYQRIYLFFFRVFFSLLVLICF